MKCFVKPHYCVDNDIYPIETSWDEKFFHVPFLLTESSFTSLIYYHAHLELFFYVGQYSQFIAELQSCQYRVLAGQGKVGRACQPFVGIDS